MKHLLFLIGSLAELLIPICSLFQIQYVSKIANRLFKGHGEIEKFVNGPRICVACPYKYIWSVVEAMLHYNWRVLNCKFEEFRIIIISIICFQLKRVENGTKDS